MKISLETFKSLLDTQKKFDLTVTIGNPKSTRVAYLVEFIEWINTLEFFKEWKKNKGKSLEIQLYELADLLAFGLSIGLQEGLEAELLNASQNDYFIPDKAINTDYILHMIAELSGDLANKEFDEDYLVLLPLLLAEQFYSIDQLIEAYNKKMLVNHERQANGY